MNDDAKFFFFLSGFFGFVFVYSFSLVFKNDFIISLIFGSMGCVTFSLFGRFFLGQALKRVSKIPSASEEIADNLLSQVNQPENDSQERASVEQRATRANMEASSKAKP